MRVGQTERFDALILAADRGSGDPVARAAGVACKPLAEVAGVPMVLRVLEALEGADTIASRTLIGPPREVLQSLPALRDLVAGGAVDWLPNAPGPSASARAGLQHLPAERKVLLTGADHALLEPRTIDYFCRRAARSEADLVVALASKELVAAAYPGARRTLVKLRDGSVGGCNLFAFPTPRGRRAAEFWQRMEAHRKQPLKLMGMLGWGSVLRYLLGILSREQALARLSRLMGLRIEVVMMPYAEAALDVDTEQDLRLIESILRGRERRRHRAAGA
jgi:GTP:adenosylcobinamide-phosphate guanylyltransferase